MTKLQSPNFHVSRTRLVIYNLPKSMTEKELKKLFIDAVISRATKQKPIIRQVWYLHLFLGIHFMFNVIFIYHKIIFSFEYWYAD